MNEERMMDELRRIAGAYLRRKLAADQIAKDGICTAKTPRGAMKFGMAAGESRAIAQFLDELSVTFGIDAWECMEKGAENHDA